jgi:hypothetical protein
MMQDRLSEGEVAGSVPPARDVVQAERSFALVVGVHGDATWSVKREARMLSVARAVARRHALPRSSGLDSTER